ncbi:polysaccharide biosynthesis protein [Candidatus Pelagibacter sp.]|nr:polysaccharide biosynthesis protein [Candidatus Pelagibacter sp.]
MNNRVHKLSRTILTLPRYAKRLFAIITDAALCVIAFWIAYFLRLDQFIILRGNMLLLSIIIVIIAIPIFWSFGLYRTMFRYSGKSSIVSISFAIFVYGMIFFSIVTIFGISGVPRSIGIIQPLVLFFAIASSRLCVRYLLGDIYQNKEKISSLPKALIYGAGSAGRQLASSLDNSYEMKVVGFVDDDELLHDQILQGKIIYPPADLSQIIPLKEVTHILLAIPSVRRSKRIDILKKINKNKVIVRTLPSVTDLVEGRVTTSDIRDLDVEDILNRETVIPNNQLLTKNINSKVVLVTGAGGSIGSELCRQIIKLNPQTLILVELSELALYQIYAELEDIKIKHKINNQIKIIPLMASVQDELRMTEIIKTFKPNTLYHAAAYKHVSIVEENIFEGIKNNVFGTLNTAKIAIANDVSDYVLISSDKAVRPTNIMGASKRLAELCLQALFNNNSNKNKIKLCMVRFGNVLESSGSVIPKFKKQIRDGGPITLTHEEVTRYFMTIPEAAQLVIQAGAMAEGADVFVLDMGDPVKIKDLAKKIITLSGLTLKDKENPDGDIKIKVIGLRPGEKLYEELLLGDNPEQTKHPKIKRAKDPLIPWSQLSHYLRELRELIQDGKIKETQEFLKEILKDYKSNSEIVDQIFKQKIRFNQIKSTKKASIKNLENITQKVVKIIRD